MNTYEFTIAAKVRVEAYSEADAKEIIQDTFGPGEECGVEITELRIK